MLCAAGLVCALSLLRIAPVCLTGSPLCCGCDCITPRSSINPTIIDCRRACRCSVDCTSSVTMLDQVRLSVVRTPDFLVLSFLVLLRLPCRFRETPRSTCTSVSASVFVVPDAGSCAIGLTVSRFLAEVLFFPHFCQLRGIIYHWLVLVLLSFFGVGLQSVLVSLVHSVTPRCGILAT